MATMSNFPTVGMTYDQNPYPGGVTYDQNPYPGDSAHDQNPVVSPTPPPLGLNIDRCITLRPILIVQVGASYIFQNVRHPGGLQDEIYKFLLFFFFS